VPFSNSGGHSEFFFEGRPDPVPAETPSAALNRITTDYAKTIGLRRVRGRLLHAGDVADAPKVALVSETLVRRHFAGQDPLGQRLRLGRTSSDFWTIVGVVGDVKNYETADRPEAQVYVPFAQRPARDLVVVVKAASDPAALVTTARAAVAAIDAGEPVSSVHTLETLIGFVTTPYEITSTFVSFFGGVTLLLAAVGVYGVLAYTFAQRTREIGIRMALGATRTDVARLVLHHVRGLVLVGLVPGLALAWVLANAMRTFLVGVTPADWGVYVSMSLLLAGVALLASFFPARRAAAVEPLTALRHD
jgi:putative ABC transport system permease protein